MERSFFESLRNPNQDLILRLSMLAKIVPLVVGFIVIISLLSIAFFIKLTATEIVITAQFKKIILYFIMVAILFPYIGLKIIQVYAWLKLKKSALNENKK